MAAALSALAVGVPTDVIDTSYFTRMTPIRWWEYPVLALTAVLTGLWVSIPRPQSDTRGRGRVIGSVTAAVFAVGCPVCNKIVVGLLGVSGALGLWAPVQPVLAVLSVVALGAAVAIRWRQRECNTEACAPEITTEASPAGRTTPASGSSAASSHP
ncbi:hypothetical protein ACFORH_00015 [Amycolatopsis roodepoortensis]|uniref:Integral membrane protein n=1 Tax=Amycolatopsis roodepoortensis TaxID=700274 RepID=A0ABR9L4C7_9PSEU|nr:hypothetical protein [Amycolatopsis roodepoortensis]MBE1575370.1 hypothetical protein [Amycolatopsis roodepoortensis]